MSDFLHSKTFKDLLDKGYTGSIFEREAIEAEAVGKSTVNALRFLRSNSVKVLFSKGYTDRTPFSHGRTERVRFPDGETVPFWNAAGFTHPIT